MAVRLPKPGHVPVIGGREEKPFACIYIVTPPSERRPVKLGYCVKLESLKKLSPLEPVEIFWVPDLNVARRLIHGACVALRLKEHEIAEGCFDTTPKKALSALVTAAIALHIPMLNNKQYLKLFMSPQKLRERQLVKRFRGF